MPRRPVVLIELTRGPFSVAEARRAGLMRWHLEGASWRRLAPGVYAWAGLPDRPLLKLEAVRLRVPSAAVFSGRTAAWLHDLEVAACDPIEMTLPGGGGGWGRDGLIVHRGALDESEVVIRHGLRATSPVRTLCDLSGQMTLVEAVVLVNMALRAGLVTHAQLHESISRRAGRKGIGAFRQVLALAEAATESPMESRLRLLGPKPRQTRTCP